jgi:hypothetical protein
MSIYGHKSNARKSYPCVTSSNGQCPDSEIRNSSISRAVRISESKDTSNLLISSVVFISKFAQSAISKSCELRNHDTSGGGSSDLLAEPLVVGQECAFPISRLAPKRTVPVREPAEPFDDVAMLDRVFHAVSAERLEQRDAAFLVGQHF